MRVHRVHEDIKDAERSSYSQHRPNACRRNVSLQSVDRVATYSRALGDLLFREIQQLPARLEVFPEAVRSALNGDWSGEC
jgi:hypothetical protein